MSRLVSFSTTDHLRAWLRHGAAALALLFAAPLAAAPSAQLAAEPDALYLGESATVTVRVRGLADGDTPSATLQCDAADIAGPGVSRQSQTTIVNGRVSSSSDTSLSFRVTPHTAGEFHIRGAMVSAGGRDIPCRGSATIRVVGPTVSPDLSITLSASRDRVLVDEPFEVYLDLVVHKLPEPFQDESPLLFHPSLFVPHVAESPSSDLIPRDAEALLNSLLARRDEHGVTINDIALGTGFGFGFPFDSPRRAVFDLPRESADLGGRPAWRYRLALGFTPQAEGDITFAPATFRGDLATGVRNGNQAVRTTLFCRSQPLVVHVVPPPVEGRPSSFCGTVGTSLMAAASLDAQSCRQGDPVRLTLDLSGAFSQRSFRAPQLASRPGFDGVFRVYDDVKTEPGSAPGSLRLTYTLRPLQAGTIELPPIDVAYYNTASNAYAVARTEPVPLRVDEVPAFDPEALFASLEAEAADAAESDTAADDLPPALLADVAALAPCASGLRAQPALLGSAVALPLLALALALARVLRRRAPAWRAEARRRRAPKRAARALQRARTATSALDAVRAFFRDAHGISAAAFTPADALDVAPESVRAELETLVQPLYDQSFLSSEDTDPALLASARERLPELLRQTMPDVGAPSLLPVQLLHASSLLVVSILVVAAVAAFGLGIAATLSQKQPANREQRTANREPFTPADRFLWEQAGSMGAKAAELEDFLAVAHVYRRLLESERARPGVWRNYGCVLLLAERPAEARDAFRRAEILSGTDADLRHGLRAALRATESGQRATDNGDVGASGADLPWYRPMLFWHYEFPLATRMMAAFIAWDVVWLAVLLLPVRRLRRAAAGIAILAVIVFALLASSAAIDAHTLGQAIPGIPDRPPESHLASQI